MARVTFAIIPLLPQTLHKEMDIPSNSNATGKCNATEQILTVSWDAPNATKDNLTLHFMKNETSKRYSLHHFEINLAPQEFSLNTTSTSCFYANELVVTSALFYVCSFSY